MADSNTGPVTNPLTTCLLCLAGIGIVLYILNRYNTKKDLYTVAVPAEPGAETSSNSFAKCESLIPATRNYVPVGGVLGAIWDYVPYGGSMFEGH